MGFDCAKFIADTSQEVHCKECGLILVGLRFLLNSKLWPFVSWCSSLKYYTLRLTEFLVIAVIWGTKSYSYIGRVLFVLVMQSKLCGGYFVLLTLDNPRQTNMTWCLWDMIQNFSAHVHCHQCDCQNVFIQTCNTFESRYRVARLSFRESLAQKLPISEITKWKKRKACIAL
jgi:hypothetical protein